MINCHCTSEAFFYIKYSDIFHIDNLQTYDLWYSSDLSKINLSWLTFLAFRPSKKISCLLFSGDQKQFSPTSQDLFFYNGITIETRVKDFFVSYYGIFFFVNFLKTWKFSFFSRIPLLVFEWGYVVPPIL